MTEKRILTAEDEAGIRNFVSQGLRDFGYDVVEAVDGLQAWEKIVNGHPFDLILLDIRMPGLSGLEVCQRLRAEQGYKTPVLMLTALGTTDEIVAGLHAGADDYLAKPFKFMELLARIEALLRRVESMRQSKATIAYADLTLDPVAHKAMRQGVSVELSTKEFRLLEYFVQHHDVVFTRRQLLRDVWDKNFDTNTNVVDVYVRYLRSKIDEPFRQHLIHTVVGEGYVMRTEVTNRKS